MKSNPKGFRIKISKERLAQLETKLKSPRHTLKAKYETTRRYAGGVCCGCEGIPKKIVQYDVKNAILIERYCNSCFTKWFKRS